MVTTKLIFEIICQAENSEDIDAFVDQIMSVDDITITTIKKTCVQTDVSEEELQAND
jgi:hypothetical protein